VAIALDGSNGVANRLADYALRVVTAAQDQKPLPDYRTTVAIPPERARQIVGLYLGSKGNQAARIIEYGGRIFLNFGTFRHQLRAAADNGAVLIDDPISFGTELEFGEAGKLKIGNAEFQRAPDPPPPPVPDRWKGLIGEYGYDHNVFYILEDRGQLYALFEWFYFFPLKEIGENEFRFPPDGLYQDERRS
jgi:hypothetical protein